MYNKTFNRLRKIIGAVLVILGVFWVHAGITAEKSQSQINWIHYSDQNIERLLEEGKPIFIDFYADWCAPCKQLDRETFTDISVTEAAKSFTMLKVDCTKPDATTQVLMDQFNVTGMPTLVFISKSGEQLDELREIGFIPPDKFLQSMEKALAAE